MLLPPAVAHGVREGTVTLAFRRWDQARVTVGGTQRTVAGVLRFDGVTEVQDADLTESDARAAGFADLATLRKAVARGRGSRLYRIELAWDRPDERVALRETPPTDTDLARISAALDRMDAARRTGPWTRQILRLIDRRPAVRAPDLAASLGRETKPFKLDVRKLKELGLTHSLPVGYELSPRGRAYLDAYSAGPRPTAPPADRGAAGGPDGDTAGGTPTTQPD